MRSGYIKGLLGGYGFAGLNIVVQIVLVPLYLRYLGKVQFGILMMLLGYVNYAAVGVNWLTGGLLRIFGIQHASGDNQEFSQAFRLGRYIYVGYALILGMAMLTVASIKPGLLFGNPQGDVDMSLWWAVLAMVVYLVLFYDLSIDRVALTAIGMQHWAFLLQIGALLIYAVGAIPLLMMGGNVTELMALMALGILGMLLLVKRLWLNQTFAPSSAAPTIASHRAKLLKQLFGRQGLGYMAYGAILLTMQADVLFLGWLGGAEVAAEYVVLWKAAEVAVLMLWRIPDTLIPDLIRSDVAGDARRLSTTNWNTWRWTLGLSVLGGVAYAFLGKWVVGLWLGKAALPEAPHAFLLAGIALFFLSSRHPAAIYAYATCHFRALLPVAGLELLIKLAVLYWAYPTFGYLAPIIGLIVANLAGIYWLYGNIAPKRVR